MADHGQRRRGSTLAEALDERRNALNVLRLGLALLVIVDHSPPLGGFGREPRLGSMSIGSLAVAGFFALSGYLIAQSRTRSTSRRYVWHRFLRIFPAYWVCLAVVAGVFGPIAWWHVHGGLAGYGHAQPLRYLVQNVPLITPRAGDLPGTLDHVPDPNAWNTPLWTLQWELACYAAVWIAARYGLLHIRRRSWIAAMFSVIVVVGLVEALTDLPGGPAIAIVARFAATFLAGTLLFLFAERVPFDGRLAAGAAVFVGTVSFLPRSHAVIALPLAYLCLWLGASWRTNLCRRVDISYGVYIYGFPVQQMLALYGFQEHGVVAYFLASVIGTVPLAVASFLLVERPAMRVRHWRRAAPQPITVLPAGPLPAMAQTRH
jgi:peptidoglycan/LPS O-acetylase OafA/YrhL